MAEPVETETQELKQLEVERVEIIWQHLYQCIELKNKTNKFNQSRVEPALKTALKTAIKSDLAKQRGLWVREHKMGNIHPVDREI
ncbi:Growth arrest-specific protein 7 [Sciurus carolinensis]|uniref:Growth arrest-specific protein 7 n=1 Tax=Sciurus carolinensis TaxID=30640 RepID=A0AA41MQG1_SCICA|nr:Growth arrest-specific protein 7 [Sciurus carolinensis]